MNSLHEQQLEPRDERHQLPLKVSLVGCGAVTERYYLPALRRLQSRGSIRQITLYDPDEKRAATLLRKLSGAQVAGSWREVLNSAADLAIVASPPQFHAQQVRELLQQRQHVLCEKPFTLAYRESVELVELAQQQARLCAVGMVRRFARNADWIGRQIQQSPDTIRRISWREGGPFDWPIRDVSYFSAKSGNELLWDIGAHVVDLVIQWLGKPTGVQCLDDAAGGTAANLRLELQFGQTHVTVRLSRDTPIRPEIRLERVTDEIACDDIFAPQLRWQLANDGGDCSLEGELRRDATPGHSAGRPLASTFEEAFHRQLENVFNSILGIDQLRAPASSVLLGIQTLERAQHFRRPLELDWLSPVERMRFQELHSGIGTGPPPCE